MVLPPPLTLRCPGGVIGLASGPQQQPPSLMPLLAYANYAVGSPQVGFFFRMEPPTILYIICLVFILVSAFYFQVPGWMSYYPMGTQSLEFAPLQPFGVYAWQAYVQPDDGHWSMPGMHRMAAPSATFSRGEPSATQSAVPHPSHLYGGVYSLGGLIESHPIWLPSLHDREGSSFPGLVPSDDMVYSEFVMGIKPNDSSVVIGFQVDEVTHTWSAEWFVAHSHIYPGFTGKVSLLTRFPLFPLCLFGSGCCWLWTKLGFHPHQLTQTPELDTSLDEPDVITSSVSSGFLFSVSTLSDNSRPQLAPRICTCKVWCQARALLAPVSLVTKMSACKLIHYFSSHPAAFGFWASTPPDNIILNSANRKANQSLWFSDWCWCCCQCYSWHRATYLLPEGCPCWYSFLTTQCWGRCYTCV